MRRSFQLDTRFSIICAELFYCLSKSASGASVGVVFQDDQAQSPLSTTSSPMISNWKMRNILIICLLMFSLLMLLLFLGKIQEAADGGSHNRLSLITLTFLSCLALLPFFCAYVTAILVDSMLFSLFIHWCTAITDKLTVAVMVRESSSSCFRAQQGGAHWGFISREFQLTHFMSLTYCMLIDATCIGDLLSLASPPFSRINGIMYNAALFSFICYALGCVSLLPSVRLFYSNFTTTQQYFSSG